MSDAGEFIEKCRRRGVQIRCDFKKNEVVLFGAPPDVDVLMPELEKNVDAVLLLCARWLSAMPPGTLSQLH